MPLVTRFDTPGSLRDAPPKSPFYDEWHEFVAGAIRGKLVDPSRHDFAQVATRTMVWMGFPRRLMMVRHRGDRRAAFAAGESRDAQEEYLEWHVTTKAGKITRVVFVTETPEYWSLLARRHPDVVLRLYRKYVSSDVARADLFDSHGEYRPSNPWNKTRGIVHYIQDINTLTEAVRLARDSVEGAPARDNYDVTPSDPMSADPRVALDIGTLGRKGLALTLAEPVGLYIAGWDDTGWTKPDGSPVGDYWRIRRGARGAALRVEYEVPASEGFVVGDIRVGGRPIRTGGEIAEHLTVTIRGLAGTRS